MPPSPSPNLMPQWGLQHSGSSSVRCSSYFKSYINIYRQCKTYELCRMIEKTAKITKCSSAVLESLLSTNAAFFSSLFWWDQRRAKMRMNSSTGHPKKNVFNEVNYFPTSASWIMFWDESDLPETPHLCATTDLTRAGLCWGVSPVDKDMKTLYFPLLLTKRPS